MSNTGRIVASALSSQQRSLDVIANNIANANTVGFKCARVEFKDLQNQAPAQTGGAAGQVSAVESTTLLMFGQGDLQETDYPLDVAIDGPGFLQVTMSDGSTAYSRDGRLRVDAQGNLLNGAGLRLVPNIIVPAGAQVVGIDAVGNVSVQVPNQATPQVVGQIMLARFPSPEGLQSLGENLYAPTAASGAATTGAPGTPGFASLRPGMVEGSNVDLAEEMTRMMQAQRAYQLGLSVIRSWDQVARDSTHLRS